MPCRSPGKTCRRWWSESTVVLEREKHRLIRGRLAKVGFQGRQGDA